MAIKFKYDEDKNIDAIKDYIGGTYGEHYALDDDIQSIDLWDAMGSSVETCRDTAIKYLTRFGKKGGRNHKDLWKAIHYILFMIFFDKKRQRKEEASTIPVSVTVTTPPNINPNAA